MTARDRTVLLVVLAAGVLGAFWFAVLGPKRHEASGLAEQIAQQRARLDDARQREATAQQARARYDDDYATVARLGKAVPVQEDVPSLVYQLDTAAQAHKIDFHDLKVNAGVTTGAQPGAGTSPPTGAAALPVIPFSFTFNGRYFDMQHFIHALDRLTFLRKDTLQVAGRLLTINGLSLTTDTTDQSKVQAQIDANAFQLPADEGLTGGATPNGPSPSSAPPGHSPAAPPTATATGVTP